VLAHASQENSILSDNLKCEIQLWF